MSKVTPKILFLDCETAPNLGWVWGRYEQDVIDIHTHWHLLSFAWRWRGQKRISCRALPDYPRYIRDRRDDKSLIGDLWKLMDRADIVIAHNGDAFDIKKFTARCLFHGIGPPSPFKSVDTLKIARKYFKMDSNKLDDLGAMLKVGRKLPTYGQAPVAGLHGRQAVNRWRDDEAVQQAGRGVAGARLREAEAVGGQPSRPNTIYRDAQMSDLSVQEHHQAGHLSRPQAALSAVDVSELRSLVPRQAIGRLNLTNKRKGRPSPKERPVTRKSEMHDETSSIP